MMFRYNTCDDMVQWLHSAEVDPRTGNKTVYNASWLADKPSMIGKRNEDWVQRELTWFKSGSNSLNDMEPPVPQAFQACAGEDQLVNSAYGHILFGSGEELPAGDSLFRRIVNAYVTEGAGTRHAVAIISDRDIHNLAVKNGRHDFICTNAVNTMITPEGHLNIMAQMRSMDAVWGYRADYSMWHLLRGMLVEELRKHDEFSSVKEGDIFFQVSNLHVYPRHFDLLDQQAEELDEYLDRVMRRVWLDRRLRRQAAQQEAEPTPTRQQEHQDVIPGLEDVK